ncbi:hypothetical protein ONO39_27880, partial [Salmonella enterica subsp. enterica serovar Anatum]|nr:hypothetical protein [Salmonella enterica subsp. enterica serovar Anatum]
KDSGLMLHLTATLARKMNKKIHVLFIDWEAQFSCTIAYIESLSFAALNTPEIKEKIKDCVFVTATDGNHGRGVAWAAEQLGL